MNGKIIKSSGNVFSDLGFNESEASNLRLRSQLMMLLETWINQSEQTQTQIAKQLGVQQSRVSDLVRGKIERFSLDMLVTMMEKTGQHVSIHVDVEAA